MWKLFQPEVYELNSNILNFLIEKVCKKKKSKRLESIRQPAKKRKDYDDKDEFEKQYSKN